MSDLQCEVVFSYQGIGKDELTLEVGQVVNIITKEAEDAGWWKGELDGVVGVFLENFVKLITKDDKGETRTKKILHKSISLEEKYDLASLKKELSKTSIKRNQSQKEMKRSKGAAPRPQNYFPMLNPVNSTNIRKQLMRRKLLAKRCQLRKAPASWPRYQLGE